jgi:hypothetical protein
VRVAATVDYGIDAAVNIPVVIGAAGGEPAVTKQSPFPQAA